LDREGNRFQQEQLRDTSCKDKVITGGDGKTNSKAMGEGRCPDPSTKGARRHASGRSQKKVEIGYSVLNLEGRTFQFIMRGGLKGRENQKEKCLGATLK